ncbi:MAG TPA: hypothetical protein VNG69_04800 [Casimicrobiaceae bacterium]|nr:hypothetical protein [Casimicrobiaceae bacterium]
MQEAKSLSLRTLVRAAAFLAAAMLFVIVIYLAFNVPGSWFPSADPMALDAGRLAVSRGRGQPIPGGLQVTSPSVNEAAVVVVTIELKSSDYSAVEWTVDGLTDSADVRLLWRNSYRPDRLNVAPMTVDGGRLRPIVIAHDPNWIGTIRGLGIAIARAPPEGVAIRGVVVRPFGAIELAMLRAGEWFTFEGWRAHSVDSVAGGSDTQDLPLPVVLAVAVALVLGIGCAWTRVRYPHRAAATVATAAIASFAAAWMIADARWTLELARQSLVTLRTFGGKSMHEAHLSADDSALYRLVLQAREKMPRDPARVFVFAEAPYFRARAAYYFYPHNPWFDVVRNGVPEASLMRPDDWIFAYRRRGVQYNQAAQRLRWDGGNEVPAALALITPDGALFRVMQQ